MSSFCLVTGAAGFIGSNLTETLLRKNRNVVALDCFLPDLYPSEIKKARWENLKKIRGGQLELVEFDLRVDDFEVLDKYNINSIFNQAAMPGLIDNWSKFKPYYDCNLSSLNRLLEYARSIEITSFIQASTSSVYGKLAIGDESGLLRPVSPYGVSKLAAEKLLFAYYETYQMPVKVLRYFSVYGPHQRPDMAIARVINSLMSGSTFSIFGDGTNRRSNTYVDDVVRATLIAEKKLGVGEVVNICGQEDHSLLETISILEEISERKLNVKYLPARKGDQRETKGSNLLARRLLDWSPDVTYLDGLTNQFFASVNH